MPTSLLGLLLCLCWTPDAPLSAERIAKVRMAIRLASLEMGSGVKLSDNKLIYVGESPLLYAQIQQQEKELAANPGDLTILRTLTMLKAQMNNPKQTQAAYQQLYQAEKASARTNPQDATAWHSLAAACWHLDKFDEALSAARKSIELDPTNPYTWTSLHLYLKGKEPIEAEKALNKAISLTPEDDVDLQVSHAIIRSLAANEKRKQAQEFDRVKQAGAIRLPEILQDDRSKAEQEYANSRKEVDRVIELASRKLKQANGQCGTDTRDRCLALLFTRDIFGWTKNDVGSGSSNGAVIKSDTLKLMREVVPLTTDDPAGLFAAMFIEILSDPNLKAKQKELPIAESKPLLPYLKRLQELSQHTDSATAGTAAYLHALACKLLDLDQSVVQQSLLRAIETCPQYNDAWQLLTLTYLEQKNFRKAHETWENWHKSVGNELSLFCGAKAYALANDWAEVQRITELGCKKFPESLHFQLAQIACDLQTGDPVEGVARAKPKLLRLRATLQKEGERKLSLNHQQLSMVMALLENNLADARDYAGPVLHEANPEERQLLRELLYPTGPMTPEAGSIPR